MKTANFLRYVLLPAAAVAAGAKLGIEYAKGRYVVKDRKFIKGETINNTKE